MSLVPIGVYYISALLRENNFNVEILNFYNFNKTPYKIKDILVEKKPDVIGFSILHANRWGGIEIAKLAKQIDPEITTVFGGIGASFLWKHLLKNFKEIDYAVIGEGEYTFLNLIRCIKEKDYKNIQNIKGLAFRKDDIIKRTEAADAIKDLDKLPNPAKYFKYQHLSLTRGCPGNCTFCGSPKFWGRKVRFHSSEYFVNQIELLYKNGITFFYFSDDTFTLKKNLVIEICSKIIKRCLKITWVAISSVNYIDEEILCWMKKAGCIQISYGVESGCEKIRNFLNKNIKTDQIKKAFNLTLKYGILARAYFIYGCPEEDSDTIQETIDLIKEIRPPAIIFYILDIFPGTELYADFKKKFKTTDDIWLNRIEDIMYFETDPDLSFELIAAFGKKLRTCFYDNINSFIDKIELTDKKEFYKSHSDFCSRLAMTFSHGDYSEIDAIKEKEKIAEKLYKKSLKYHIDHRAYLGLGIIKQKKGLFEESVEILSEGVKYFSESESLNICLGISYMNLEKYLKALAYFLKFQDSKAALYHSANCYRALGDFEKETAFLKKIHLLQ